MPLTREDVPPTWPGSAPEYAVYLALLQLGYKDGEDFIYQSPQAGGRQEYGGAVLDFTIPDLNLAINVQSRYYHSGFAERTHDAYVRAMMASWGVTVIFIDEDMAMQNAKYYVMEAIAGRDHSTGRG